MKNVDNMKTAPNHQIIQSSNLDKGVFVSDIQAGTTVEGLFCVRSKRLLETRNRDPYLAVTLIDRTGEMEGRVWDGARELDALFGHRDYVRIVGDAQKFRDAVQLKITRLERVIAEGIDPGLFLPVTQADIGELWSEFRKYIKGIKSPVLASLLQGIFKDRRISKAFKQAPAAKRMHHACIGGLLEHTVSVTRLADSVCTIYRQLDRDLLVSAALIHDIGKIDEFTYTHPPIDYSDRGRLLGHVVMGVSIIDGFIAKLGLMDSSQEIVVLKHLVLSHHGQREFGAPVLPMVEEALTLNLIDDLDAKLNYLKNLKRDITGPGYSWTEYQRLFERFFYLRGMDEAQDEPDGGETTEGVGEKDRSDIQPGLWSREKAE